MSSMIDNSTIAAISTPLGEAGIGIVRLSGPKAFSIARKVFRSKSKRKLRDFSTHTLHYGQIIDPESKKRIDEVLLSLMSAPRTYTREDVVEINCHGGIVPLREVLELVLREGAHLAQPGEFTRRAFLNGRIDLAQAEAVIDIIKAKTKDALKLATSQAEGKLSLQIQSIREELLFLLSSLEVTLDYPEEEIEELTPFKIRQRIRRIIKKIEHLLLTAEKGKILREGISTVIVGRANVGKSSLLNALLKDARAIVTNIPGTTRDIIEEVVNIQGIPFRLQDTAGLRKFKDKVEKISIEFTRQSLDQAELVLLVIDSSKKITREDREIMAEICGKKTIVVFNKIDLPAKIKIRDIRAELKDKTSWRRLSTIPTAQAGNCGRQIIVKTSLTQGRGLDDLEKALKEVAFGGEVSPGDALLVSNLRHKEALLQAKDSLKEAITATCSSLPSDLIALDLRQALNSLGEITGETVGEEILEKIFSEFCVGK